MILNLAVELVIAGEVVRAVTQDLSPFGMFVRLERFVPIGTEVELAITVRGVRHTAPGVVVHALDAPEAQTLGRQRGLGVMFRGARPGEPGAALATEVIRLIENHVAAHAQTEDLHIVIADPSTRLLERLSTALGNAGFSVATATNGMEAIGAALTRTPDVVLVERDMPVVDGLHVLSGDGPPRRARRRAGHDHVGAEHATDLERLRGVPARRRRLHPEAVHRARGDPARAAAGRERRGATASASCCAATSTASGCRRCSRCSSRTARPASSR